ncbi:hypothetical protein B0H13DRAFT_2314791 [Mycena leptocephala]|nr:hypothetical protein B0H13DRAFT_2314791 [Mycena leptocephala]
MSGKYIVVFKPTASKEAITEFLNNFKGNLQSDGKFCSVHRVTCQKLKPASEKVNHEYDTIMKGFAATLNQNTLTKFQSFQAEPDSIIDFIEPDGVVTTQ